jgi:hypothetical protein
MIYKLTSVKRVIAKVFTDLDLKEGDHRISDMVEWAGEALEKIGAFPQFINKVTGKDNNPLLELSNYQTVLPYDFHRLVQCSYSTSESGPFYPMRAATGSMDYGNELNDSSQLDVDNVSDSELVNAVMELYELTYVQALAWVNDNPSRASQVSYLLDAKKSGTDVTGGTTSTIDYIYHVTNNYIKTNQETGYLMLAYQAIPTDAEGYPLIPDVASFHEALYWYINMKLLYPQWKMGQVRDAVYYDARRSWNFYCKQAYGDAMMPDADQMESVKNAWLRLVPSINEHSTFFSTLGEQEIVWNHNKS